MFRRQFEALALGDLDFAAVGQGKRAVLGEFDFVGFRQANFLGSSDGLPDGEHNFSGDIAKQDLARVEDEGGPLAVSADAFGDVGGDEVPVGPENVHHLLERCEIIVDLLDRDQVKGGDHLGDVVIRFAKPGALAELVGIEVANIPGRQQQRIAQRPRGNLGA